ncbi:MAG: hypothetical protein U5N86_06790 [Planctomycetota bacterium]|nr:hypothetical protein [Planctomycetota bacterium]
MAMANMYGRSKVVFHILCCFLLLIALAFVTTHAEDARTVHYSTQEEAIFRFATREFPDKTAPDYQKYRTNVDEVYDYVLTTGMYLTTPSVNGKAVALDPEKPLAVELRSRPQSGLQQFIAGLAELKILEFSLSYRATLAEQMALLEIQDIVSITYSKQSINSRLLRMIGQCSSLESITFEQCSLATEKIPNSWSPEKLNTLQLLNCSGFLPLYRTIAQIPGIQHLSLTGSEITNDVISGLQGTDALKSFTLESDEVTDDCTEFLGSCAKLEDVALRGDRLTGNVIDNLRASRFIRKLELDIRKGIEQNLRLSENFPRLEELILTDTDVRFANTNTTQRRLISLKISSRISPAFLHLDRLLSMTYDLEYENPKLLRLSIPQAQARRLSYSSDRVLSIAFGSSRLASLVINAEICTDDFIDTLAPAKCDCIRELGIDGARLYENLGQKGIQALCNAPGVRRLSIKNQFFPCNAWAENIDPRRELRYLCLNNIGGMKDETLTKLSRLEALEEVDVTGNPEITANGMRKLASLPNLRVLLPLPSQMMKMHELSVIAKMREIAEVQEREMLVHSSYFRDSTKIIPYVGIDTRDGRHGYAFRYFSNSDTQDSDRYAVLAFPKTIAEGSVVYLQTEKGLFSSAKFNEDLLEKCKKTGKDSIDFNKESTSRVDGLDFYVYKEAH